MDNSERWILLLHKYIREQVGFKESKKSDRFESI